MRSPTVLWMIAGTIAAAPLAWLLPASWSARSAAQTRLDQLASATESGHRIADIERALPEWTRRTPVAGGLAQDVAAVLAASGLPPATLGSLAGSGDEGLDASPTSPASTEPRAVRRRANLTLSGLTLPQLGAFLNHFRMRLEAWTVTSVDITPTEATATTGGATGGGAGVTGGGAGSGSGGSDLPLRVQLTVETLSLTRPSATKAPSPIIGGNQ